MPVSPARAAAFDILLRIERDQAYASELLHSPRLAKLSSNDRGLAMELVMGVLRWRSLLDQRLADASSHKLNRIDPEVLAALRLGLYQLQFLSRVPARAAIYESVELVKGARKRSAASFVNAILRKADLKCSNNFLEQIEHCVDVGQLAACSSHPEWLVARWGERYGLPSTRQICLYNQTPPAGAVHFQDQAAEEEVAGTEGLVLRQGLLLRSARRVESGDATKTAAYREGRISIQDEGSQLVALLVGCGERILDCCAAPGGKTALLARRNSRSQVFATELYPHRARRLRHLVNLPNVHVLAADARQLPFDCEFDRILADVPCSGTGTLARNPEIKWRLKFEDLADLHSRQIAILKSALGHLSRGGRLVYSTCSLEWEENEAVVTSALEGCDGFQQIDCHVELERLQSEGELCWEDVDSLLAGPYLRTLPGKHPCDGFFAAIIERRA